MSKKQYIILTMLLVLFAFGLGLSVDSTAYAGPSGCCYLEETPYCSAGIGVWHQEGGFCKYDLSYPGCSTQVAPICW